MKQWLYELIIALMISLLVLTGVKLIRAHRQLQAVEQAVLSCEGGTYGNLTLVPVDCDKGNRAMMIGYTGYIPKERR